MIISSSEKTNKTIGKEKKRKINWVNYIVGNRVSEENTILLRKENYGKYAELLRLMSCLYYNFATNLITIVLIVY